MLLEMLRGSANSNDFLPNLYIAWVYLSGFLATIQSSFSQRMIGSGIPTKVEQMSKEQDSDWASKKFNMSNVNEPVHLFIILALNLPISNGFHFPSTLTTHTHDHDMSASASTWIPASYLPTTTSYPCNQALCFHHSLLLPSLLGPLSITYPLFLVFSTPPSHSSSPFSHNKFFSVWKNLNPSFSWCSDALMPDPIPSSFTTGITPN